MSYFLRVSNTYLMYLLKFYLQVATMFAVMKDTDYMQKDKFKENFWNDWRKVLGRNHVIQSLAKCDFTPIYNWYQQEKEKKKQLTTEVSW
jgi:DNA topoisomerase-1